MNKPKYTTALCVFVKTPGLSPVKTRLANTIGDKAALKVYNKLLEVLKELLDSLVNIDIYWAVNEGSEAFKYWESYPCLTQVGENNN